ncbi:hypothetical protein [Catellatospora sichuanensis]|uniref:hypothetical protein n=1 Tax=Catellatospora sichuanensis TaxID=1969805 RepID=UPI0011829A3D|nr:hypothetical protein [Catellatospora sichuanensis]
MKSKAVVLSVCTALVFGVLGAALGGWLGWRDAPALPTTEQAQAIAATAFPGVPITKTEVDPSTFDYDPGQSPVQVALVGGDDYYSGYVVLTLATDADPVRFVQTAADRLAAAGWEVDNVPDYGYAARKDQWHLTIHDSGGFPATATSADVDLVIERAEPGPVPSLTLLGALLGIALGWLLSAQPRRRPVSPWGRGPWIAGLVLLVPAAVVVVSIAVTQYLLNPATVEPMPIWDPIMTAGVRGCTLLGIVLLLAGMIVTRVVGEARPR